MHTNIELPNSQYDLMGKENLSPLHFFGFTGLADFVNSFCKPKLLFTFDSAEVLALLAVVMTAIENWIGLPQTLIFGFIVLNILEWFTGVRAALSEGKTFSSVKFSRAILKTAVYAFLLFFLNQTRLLPQSLGAMHTLFDFSYWTVFSGISLVLIRSIFENLHRMGVKEASTINAVLDNRYTRFLAILSSPPDEEKTNRPQ